MSAGICPLFLIIMSVTTKTNSYFAYDDCLPQCKNVTTSCLITQLMDKSFDRECMKNIQHCQEQASNSAACASLDEPTIGGASLWERYKAKRPTPPTPDLSACYSKYWMLASLTQSGISSLALLAILILKISTIIKRSQYLPISNRTPDNPYQDTVESMDNEHE